MSYFVVDIEADHTTPATGSMISLGAVKVVDGLEETFYGELAPISPLWNPDALAVSGFSREETLEFPEPDKTMKEFNEWILDVNGSGRPTMFSDNIAFDWMWTAYYFDMCLIKNPFGWSGRRIGDLVCGLENDMRFQWKKWRKTKHDHNPVNDAKGNAEVLIKLRDDYNLNIKLK